VDEKLGFCPADRDTIDATIRVWRLKSVRESREVF